MNLIDRLAFKFCKNKFLRLTVRPIYNVVNKALRKRKFNQRKRLFRQNGLIVLNCAKETFDNAGIGFWLEFGTLLGAYREKGFITHDFDIDIAAFFEDKDRIRTAMLNGGFELIREFRVGEDGAEGFEETYRYKDVTFDVFYFHLNNNEIYCNTFSRFQDEHRSLTEYQVKKLTFPYDGFKTINFLGLEVSIPANVEDHLKSHYGESFMIPNPSFSIKDVHNIEWYSYDEKYAVFSSWE